MIYPRAEVVDIRMIYLVEMNDDLSVIVLSPVLRLINHSFIHSKRIIFSNHFLQEQLMSHQFEQRSQSRREVNMMV